MEREDEIARYAALYGRLIRLYPTPHRKKFGKEMEQLFRDRLRDRVRDGRSIMSHAVWMFGETTVELARQNASAVMQQNVVRLAFVTLCLLLVPAVAMQMTDEVDWTVSDFVFAGAAVFGTGLTYELVMRQRPGILYRCTLAVALMSALLLFWINGAVGLIGSESDDFNLLYGGVLAVGVVGSTLARLRPRGMARTMLAMAFAHGCIGAAAIGVGKHGGSGAEALEILGVTGLFVALFLGAALLFRRATRRRTPADT